MNQDILQGKWKQVRGEIRSWWGKLTNDDLDRIEGSKDRLSGILQERYGYSLHEAQREIADFMEQIETQDSNRIRKKQNRRHYVYDNIAHHFNPHTVRCIAYLAIQPQLGLRRIRSGWLLAPDPDRGTAAWLVLTRI